MNDHDYTANEQTAIRLYRHAARELPSPQLDDKITAAARRARPMSGLMERLSFGYPSALAAGLLTAVGVTLLVMTAPEMPTGAPRTLAKSWAPYEAGDSADATRWIKPHSFKFLPNARPSSPNSPAFNVAKLEDDYLLRAIGTLFDEQPPSSNDAARPTLQVSAALSDLATAPDDAAQPVDTPTAPGTP